MNHSNSFVYASLGSQIEVFKLGQASDGLTSVQSLRFDEAVQYAWPNRGRTIFYVVSSGSGPMAKNKDPNHFVQAFRILQDGVLEPIQDPVRLKNRPLFVTLDREEKYLLIAYNNPSDVTVHRMGADGEVDEEVLQKPLYFGQTVHQVRVTPHGNIVIVPACAHDENGIPAGCVDLFNYEDGHLSPLARITADPDRAEKWRGIRLGAQGFSARHVDFHPMHSWMYLVVETQGELHLFDYDENGVAPEPRFIKSTLENAPVGPSTQLAGAIQIHPNGRFVYVTNRAWDTALEGTTDVFTGGANTVAVFELDQSSGEPKLIQQIDTQGISPRTFGMDASGKTLVVGNQEPGFIRSGDTIRRVVPNLVVFEIGKDGRLKFVLQHDLPDNEEVCFWSTVLTLDNSNPAVSSPNFTT